MSWNLPKLPGYSFGNPEKTDFHLPSKLKYDKGYAYVRPSTLGIGKEEMDAQGTQFLELDGKKFDPQLVYGGRHEIELPIPVPHYVRFDKKMLILKAYRKENDMIYDTSTPIRYVNIIYHLEDDTMNVGEPHIKNSGLCQGKIVKRGKIMKDDKSGLWHWKDLNVGVDLKIYGMVFHTVSCDDFTKQFLESQGIELGENEEIVDDEDTSYFEKSDSVSERPTTPQRNLQRYLIYDNQALRFDAMWSSDDHENPDTRNYKLSYYLYDNTISIKECYGKNDGRDPFTMLLRRTRVPKDWKNHRVCSPLVAKEPPYNDKDNDKYYNAKDLVVGNTINVLGRLFMLLDCDYNTRNYYKDVLHISQPPKVNIPIEEPMRQSVAIPPHIGIGDPEDTLMSCFSFNLKSPRKDVLQYNINANKHLRYLCEMIAVQPECKNRKFVLLYNLADGTIKLDEVSEKNSGIIGGRFFGPSKVHPPGATDRDYYTPDLFYIGAIIIIRQHKFIIIGADLRVYRYMQQFPDKFPSEVIQNMRDYHIGNGNIREEVPPTEIPKETPIDNSEFVDYAGPSDDAVNQSTVLQPQLPAALEGLECAQTMPINTERDRFEDEKRTAEPFTCLTGITRAEGQQKLMPIEHEYSTNVNISPCQCDVNPEKRVTFANLPNED